MIFSYEFMQHALYAGIVVGIISPLVGVFLVVRRLSLIAEALSHINLSGIAAGMLLQQHVTLFQMVNPLYIGMLFSVAGSLCVERIRRLYRSYQELAIPIILSTGVAIGVILISAGGGFNSDISGYLFGNILAVSLEELYMILGVGMVVCFFVFILYKELFALSFDEEHAILTGIRRRLVNFMFIVIVALVISVTIRVVGILLVSALMTIPVASSLQFVRSFRQAIFWSIVFAQIAVFSGLIAAYYLDWASGGTIVLASIVIFLTINMGKRIRLFWRTKKVSSP